jgi:23S rRNA pseudouridine1911/1915/1917 synthase
MEPVRHITFDHGRAPERLDRFLADQLPDLSRSQLKKLIDEGGVLLQGAPAKPGVKLRGGESLLVTVPAPIPVATVSQDIPLRILYEDRHLIVVDKPAGMVVHPAPGHQQDTLVNALLFHCRDLSGIGGELRPGIVHRLDKDTSGVMVATKTDLAHGHLAKQFKDHSVRRRYVALLYGLLTGESGTIDQAIGRHPQHRQKMSTACRSGRRAVTHWQVLRSFVDDRLTLIELALETGRTHQIRVHLSEQHHPLVGDPVYGGTGRCKNLADAQLRRLVQDLGRQALHARLLGFVHPETGRYLEFSSPLPRDLTVLLNYLTTKYHQTPVVWSK